MKPKPQRRDVFDLFQAHFDQILTREHALVHLADKIDWSRFEVAFADSYSEDMGAPAKAVRLMVGLQYLKYTPTLHKSEVAAARNGQIPRRIAVICCPSTGVVRSHVA